ncbi:MAG TPA: O-antigen ligase family protein [Phycisphaerae bacterium]|nr:O-antigen ligase family protein [Phycisphaerae bacterium]
MVVGMEPVPASEWPASKYVYVMLAAGSVSLLALGVGSPLGQAALVAVVAGFAFGLLVLWRPEFGVLLIVLFVPFETYGALGEGFSTITKIIGVFTLAALVPHLLRGRSGHLGNAAFWLAVAFATWSMLTLIGSPHPEWAWPRVLTRFQLVGLMFLVLNACATKEQLAALCWLLLFAAAAASVAAFFLTPRVVQEMGRVTVGAVNINEHAKNLIGGILVTPFLMRRSGAKGRLVAGLAALVVLVGIVMTGSRSTYLAVAVGAVVAAAVYRPFSLPARTLLVIFVAAFLVLFVYIGFASGLFDASLGERTADAWRRGLESGGRIRLWRAAVQVGMEHPFMGIGAAQFRLVSQQYGARQAVVHNDLLAHFAETGIPGLGLYVAFLIAVFRTAWRVTDEGLRAVLVGLVAAAFTSSLANPSHNMKSFWLQMGLCILGGVLYAPQGRGGETAAVAEGSGLLTRADAGSPVPMDHRV